jgi:tRNA(fMet)-specific endonuclease VapC
MAEKIVLVDTSILIDYFRKSDKSNSKLISLTRVGYTFQICVITEYEIYSGATIERIPYWQEFLEKFKVLSFDSRAANDAVKINKALKVKRKQ